ncbi:beta and beta-prime subunits of DNA dependent RNA-polymerase [Anaeromyces robustus]|uniref:DNA-directed RNA polymerase subunit beta n=1 Tax=Anaeromyces robustus TaxID=1754192 RepID=A0A1Y1XEV7_9FUNG|nr:beta and beta-prime subunits of DNA dependent RNA-polymerase [Anaeromyces robustus]|eukprot:ORX84247.1 beta and beta-prime subunits of DNA dependent RNA-polymerase [Anaeromyces robustus]
MPSTFHTLEREREFKFPSKTGSNAEELQKLSEPHVESFNAIFHVEGSKDGKGLLDRAVEDISPCVIFDGKDSNGSKGNKLKFWIEEVNVGKPSVMCDGHSKLLYPYECRERGITYKSKMQAKFCWTVNDGPENSEVKNLGYLPIMVRSSKCNLYGLSSAELIKKREDSEEFGGYFVINGIERLIRLLIIPRRNNPIALIRSSFQNRGPTYTHFGVSIRCARPDQTSQTVTIHYCTDGNVTLRFIYRKQEYMVPLMLILKSLVECSDKEIFERVIMGNSDREVQDTFVTDRMELLLRDFKKFNLYNREQCLAYLGTKFHVMMDSPDDMNALEVGKEFLKRVILVHLNDDREKFNILIFMLQKLYALVAGKCVPDNPDSPMNQEVLLGGFLYLAHIKEKLVDILAAIKGQINQDIRRGLASVDFFNLKYIQKVMSKVNVDVGRKMEFFLATGNLITNTGLDLQQVSGYTVVAEKLNYYRYLSHFRSIHRGSFFAELKTTSVRKLLPEAWGFLCPVHTPDGGPCGLLNHLSHKCKIITSEYDISNLPKLIISLGVSPIYLNPVITEKQITLSDEDKTNEDLMEQTIMVMIDGKVIGWCSAKKAKEVADTLRFWKVNGRNNVPLDIELAFIPPSRGGQYPGLFIFTTMSRMMRPVKYLANGKKDMVGSLEQVYMEIACLNEDIVPGVTTHQDFAPTDMLSVIANMTPFSDFNQSPRNLYQCQMGKQTMGTPAHNLPSRTDNKMYRLQTGQTPIVRPKMHDKYKLDYYPNGMNAVVAVISYTGYDMEDAMILNKSSEERGFGHGVIYKSHFIDLTEKCPKGEPNACYFKFQQNTSNLRNLEEIEKAKQTLDQDGLPIIGAKLTTGCALYSYFDETSGQTKIVKYKEIEDGFVQEVRALGDESNNRGFQKAQIKIRITRRPIIGDKFSSRHGQKGVCSLKWPMVDMPFSESGIVPDVIINPHAFPSRMTIGMFVESMAGKSGALHGIAQDSTPFQFSEDHQTAVDYFGEQLKAAGYNYYGNEPMYSGITGKEFKADIYLGVVYYQRLRHMVSDKYQVRTTGPVHNLTQQPVKGRKRAGGIRFGEMERDSLIAHGVSYTLQDRLMNCSDYSQAYVCKKCGSILSPMAVPNTTVVPSKRESVVCGTCNTHKYIDLISVPYVFRYLCTELLSMKIRLKLEVD